MLNKSMTRLLLGFGASLLFASAGGALAQTEQQKLVDRADKTLSNFLRDPDMTWLQQNIGRAKAVMIAPEVVKAGFIFGGSGGRAVTVARDEKTGKWAGPAFYTLATASVGFQAGVSVSEVVTLVMTEKGLNSLLAPSVKLGGDASVAAGPIGAGAKSDVVADFVSFSRAKGLYGGLNLDGTVIAISNEWNEAYYNKKGILPPDIIVRMTARNKGGDKLVTDVCTGPGDAIARAGFRNRACAEGPARDVRRQETWVSLRDFRPCLVPWSRIRSAAHSRRPLRWRRRRTSHKRPTTTGAWS
ncbi:MAG: lipid-binding SYLF domain-containing protein [Betaproteobacteria bacterium]|nr:MAG: lipid-binding SYLF domain-containing protein [Betaproteobacteria bacterium]